MWQGTWDPEGVLSTFPAIVTGITGMLAGHLIVADQISGERKVTWLYLAGFATFSIGSMWDWAFPLNKNLWTSSFVLYTSGLAAMALASLYFIVELLGHAKWATFGVVFGSNAITAYAIGSMLPEALPGLNNWYSQSFIAGGSCPEIASLVWALGICLWCYLTVYMLYRKRIFIKI